MGRKGSKRRCFRSPKNSKLEDEGTNRKTCCCGLFLCCRRTRQAKNGRKREKHPALRDMNNIHSSEVAYESPIPVDQESSNDSSHLELNKRVDLIVEEITEVRPTHEINPLRKDESKRIGKEPRRKKTLRKTKIAKNRSKDASQNQVESNVARKRVSGSDWTGQPRGKRKGGRIGANSSGSWKMKSPKDDDSIDTESPWKPKNESGIEKSPGILQVASPTNHRKKEEMSRWRKKSQKESRQRRLTTIPKGKRQKPNMKDNTSKRSLTGQREGKKKKLKKSLDTKSKHRSDGSLHSNHHQSSQGKREHQSNFSTSDQKQEPIQSEVETLANDETLHKNGYNASRIDKDRPCTGLGKAHPSAPSLPRLPTMLRSFPSPPVTPPITTLGNQLANNGSIVQIVDTENLESEDELEEEDGEKKKAVVRCTSWVHCKHGDECFVK